MTKYKPYYQPYYVSNYCSCMRNCNRKSSFFACISFGIYAKTKFAIERAPHLKPSIRYSYFTFLSFKWASFTNATCTQYPPYPHAHTGLVETGVKEVIFSGHRKGVEGVVGHTGHVLALAVSSDGKFLVSVLTCNQHNFFIQKLPAWLQCSVYAHMYIACASIILVLL